jgi:hypothetical protein
MKFFLHENSIRIINGALDLTFTPQEFSLLEPTYPALPSGIQTRYWTPERAYISGGESLLPIDHDCEPYVNAVQNYITPAIWAHVSLSKETLCINSDPADFITFSAALRVSPDPESLILPINYSWNLKLRDENGLIQDTFHSIFVNGAFSGMYSYKEGLPLGRYHLDEADFDRITVGATTYSVKLTTPLEFTIYRNL